MADVIKIENEIPLFGFEALYVHIGDPTESLECFIEDKCFYYSPFWPDAEERLKTSNFPSGLEAKSHLLASIHEMAVCQSHGALEGVILGEKCGNCGYSYLKNKAIKLIWCSRVPDLPPFFPTSICPDNGHITMQLQILSESYDEDDALLAEIWKEDKRPAMTKSRKTKLKQLSPTLAILCWNTMWACSVLKNLATEPVLSTSSCLLIQLSLCLSDIHSLPLHALKYC
eukprot:Gb_30414 [translate_table: standard]